MSKRGDLCARAAGSAVAPGDACPPEATPGWLASGGDASLGSLTESRSVRIDGKAGIHSQAWRTRVRRSETRDVSRLTGCGEGLPSCRERWSGRSGNSRVLFQKRTASRDVTYARSPERRHTDETPSQCAETTLQSSTKPAETRLKPRRRRLLVTAVELPHRSVDASCRSRKLLGFSLILSLKIVSKAP